ncbi:hypothetical protein BB559_003260 [Furculomyces boomerangus]|uniref:LITAF domain-containing protein n=1 Tax=Furculomyces boomerangus TaxID=61424 RepID=A0A2T9YMD8_9FUNG|nr:hypothetical protein BB559_003260 [Furculomyces boomerangus]
MYIKRQQIFEDENQEPYPQESPPPYSEIEFTPNILNLNAIQLTEPQNSLSREQPIDQSISQPINQSVSQPIDQSVSQSTDPVETVIPGISIDKAKREPVNITCPNCHKNIVTRIKRVYGSKTLLWVIAMSLFNWRFMWVPLLFDSLKNIKHLCPSCGIKLGKLVYLKPETH